MEIQILIFTDLDGTLLNHDDYSYADAQAALDCIRKRDISLVFVTSKTRKEVEILRDELSVKEPFIVENGGGIFFPAGYRDFEIRNSADKAEYSVIELGRPYKEIRSFFLKVKDAFEIRGFGDMEVGEIVKLTNLPLEKARLAREREFTEPFVIREEKKIVVLKDLASQEGLKIAKGGRFYHLIGINQDKGKAVELTKGVFEENFSGKVLSIGLGDSENDVPMLEAVDMPILMPKASGAYEHIEFPTMIRARHPGSGGWNEAVLEVLASLL